MSKAADMRRERRWVRGQRLRLQVNNETEAAMAQMSKAYGLLSPSWGLVALALDIASGHVKGHGDAEAMKAARQ